MSVHKCQANVKILKKQLSDLEDEKDCVKHCIEDNHESGEDQNQLQKFKKWLTSAENCIVTTNKLVKTVEELEKKKSSFGMFLNPKSPYQLSKKAEQNCKDIAELVQEARGFNIPPSYRKGKEVVDGFEDFDSRRDVLTKIMEALKNPSIKKIGLYGEPGMGKTMLVREVKRKAEQAKLFDAVVMTTLGRNPDFPRIQDELAHGLGVDRVSIELTSQEASNQIKAWLTDEKVLLILDDIWAPAKNLELLGLPSVNENEDSLSYDVKILLTSRDRAVLSTLSQKQFEVGPLKDDEAGKLFQKIAADPDESRAFPFYAFEIVSKCEGLPITVATLASALKSRNLIDWKTTLRKLQNPPSHQSNSCPIPRSLHSAVKLSYSGLKSKELQQTFLLYSLMGHNAAVQDLLNYGIGLGLFPGVNSIEEARDEALKLVTELRDSSLLLGSNMHFDMHDLVRDSATSIARDNGVLTIREDASNWSDVSMESIKWIYLSNGDFRQLLDQLKCPQLTFFHLSNKDPSLAIPPNLFRGMGGLRVLGLTKMHFQSMPSSISLLVDLHTLRLDQSVLQVADIGPILGELENLQVLSLAGCDINELPEQIGQLTKLKLLDLSDCIELKVIPPGVLSRLSELEELYLRNSFHQWKEGLEEHENQNASLYELQQLMKLNAIEVRIIFCNIQTISKCLSFEKLKRYKVFIGDVWNNWNCSFESLKVKLDANSLDDSDRMLLKKATELHLEEVKGIKNVVDELDEEGFQRLKYLLIQDALDIQHIIEYSMNLHNAFPVLEKLVLCNLQNMEKICHGQLGATSFSKLRMLAIECCSKLKNLFSSSTARQLPQLQEIKVTECSNMEVIVDDEEQGSGNDLVEATKPKFGELLRSLRLERLPKLISFNRSCEDLTLFNQQVVFPNLKELHLSWINVNTISHPSTTTVEKLMKLTIEGCDNLEYLFSSSMARGMVMLEHLEIKQCEKMREVLSMVNVEDNGNLIFPQLRVLLIEKLPKLRMFCSESYIKCPCLSQLTIDNCPILKTFISGSTFGHMTATSEEAKNMYTPPLFDTKVVFPNLKELHLSWINVNTISHPSTTTVEKLVKLTIEGCDNLEYLFSSSMARGMVMLEHLEIKQCEKMREVLSMVNVEDNGNLIFPQLRVLLIEKLPKLRMFCSENYIKCPCLSQLTIGSCPILKTFISGSTFGHMTATSEEAKNIYTPPLFDTKVQFPNLQILMLSSLTIQQIWHNQHNTDTFCQLNYLNVDSCDRLLNIFPLSMMGRLQRLNELEIWNCDSLEEIFESEGLGSQSQSQITTQSSMAEPTIKFVFPKLTHLDLYMLPKLKGFYRPMHTTEWPSLTKLEVCGCDQVQIFGSEFSSFRRTNKDDQIGIEIKFPFFLINKATFPCLEELKLESNNITKEIWHGQYLGDYFPKLKVLELIQFPEQSVVQPLFFQSLPNLEKLVVSKALFHEIFQCQGLDGEENPALALTHLSKSRLSELHELTYLWKEESHLELVFYTLKTLEVQECSKIKNLVPSFISFKNLTTLKVSACHELINLVGYSTAKSMGQLTRMSISECKMIKEILACLDDEVQDGIVFSQLKYLELCDLPRLASFCSGNCSFEFTSLEEVIVMSCPIMQIFSQGECRTPNKLQKVKFIKDEDEGFWEGNLNSTIQKMFMEKVGYSDLKLSEFPELIENWYKKPQEKFLFKRLKSLEVCNCNNMRYLLTPSMALGLVQLHDLKVTNCAMMEQVIIGEGFEEMFPLLNSIILECCSNLICFYERRKRLKFESLKQITIADCPILVAFATSFSREQGKEIIADDKGSEERPDIPNQPFFSDKVAFPNLEELQLSRINVNTMWQTPIRSYVEKLIKLIIKGCDNLKYLFSYSMARHLVMLGYLEINGCKKMREVLFTENVEENGNLIFPRLRFLLIQSLPKLRGFCYGNYIKFPCLSQLSIKCCPVLKTFISGSTFGHMTTTSYKAKNICTPLFNKKVTFTKLEQLVLEYMGSLDQIWDNQLDADSFCQLNQLSVWNCGKLLNIFPFSMLEKLQNLDNLKIWNCDSLEEIFESQGVGVSQSQAQNITHSVEPATKFVFSTLTCVELHTLPKLKAFCHQMYTIECPSLKELKMSGCDQVQTFASELLSFPKTKGDNNKLEIQNKYPLFWISKATFPSLEELELHRNGIMKEIWHGKYSGDYFPKLTRMMIRECDMLKEIVACVDDKEKDGIIVFSQLKHLELCGLPRLASFCSTNCSFEFASLEEVIVMGCPNMQIFSQMECSTPNKLQKVKFTDEGAVDDDEDRDEDEAEAEGFWEGNLNSTIQKMFTKMVGYHGLEN